MAMDAFPHPGIPVVCIPLGHYAQVTADVTTGVTLKIPFKCRVIGLGGHVRAIGGTTPFTDVDLVFKNVTKTETIGTAALVDSSAIVSGGGDAAPASAGVADIDAGDVVEMEVDITGGGGSPTADGIMGHLWVARE